jgi:hypothetical protein
MLVKSIVSRNCYFLVSWNNVIDINPNYLYFCMYSTCSRGSSGNKAGVAILSDNRSLARFVPRDDETVRS